MIKTGLVSISFRKMTPPQIAEMVAKAGLDGIEWGGDVHAPHGDVAAARQVRKVTLDNGLKVAAYGSYYTAGTDGQVPFEKVVDSAVELGAPTIRIWAGKIASADAPLEHWCRMVADVRRAADLAAAQKITLSFEYHRKTLTDTRAAAVRLLLSVMHPNVYTYWQPPIGWSVEERHAALLEVLPRLTNLHVYFWAGEKNERRPIADGTEEWLKYLRLAALTGREHYAMIEFVKDDSADSFAKDAATLKEWVRTVG